MNNDFCTTHLIISFNNLLKLSVPTFLTLFAFQGSKLTDLDLQFSSSQKEVHVTIDNIKETLANVKKQKVGHRLLCQNSKPMFFNLFDVAEP